MKKISFIIVALLIAGSSTAYAAGAVAGLFDGGARNLAKQAAGLVKKAAELEQAAAALERQAAELRSAAESVEGKAAALAPSDRRAFQAELARLGFTPPEGLFADAHALISGAPEPEPPTGFLAGLVGLFRGIVGGGGRSDRALNGTWWDGENSGATVTFNNGGMTIRADGVDVMRCTYTAAGGSLTFTVTEINAAAAGYPIVGTGMVTKSQFVAFAVENGMSRDQAATMLDEEVYRTETSSYSIDNNNRLTFSGGDLLDGVFIRQGSAPASGSTAAAPAPATPAPATPAPATTTRSSGSSGGPTNWTRVADSTFGTNWIRGIAYGNNRWVAGGEDGKMAYSTDNGVTWTAVANSGIWEYQETINNGIWTFVTDTYAIAYGNNRFVAVGGQGKMAYSTDGATWTAVADSTFGTSSIRAIAYANNRWVAVGGGGKIAYSTDGARWTAVADSTINTLFTVRGIAYGNNRWGAGGGNDIAYSTDGARWTAVRDHSTIGSLRIYGIAFGNNRWVAGGEYGRMAYSTDGVTWTAVADSTFGGTSSITAITYANNRFVAVGEGGKMAYSADGVTWTAAADSAFGTSAILNIAYGNNRFVAVGNVGRIVYADW